MEHKLIQGGEEYLPFARSRIKALRATGLKYATQKYQVDGVEIKVQIVDDQEYIWIEGGERETVGVLPGVAYAHSTTMVNGVEIAKTPIKDTKGLRYGKYPSWVNYGASPINAGTNVRGWHATSPFSKKHVYASRQLLFSGLIKNDIFIDGAIVKQYSYPNVSFPATEYFVLNLLEPTCVADKSVLLATETDSVLVVDADAVDAPPGYTSGDYLERSGYTRTKTTSLRELSSEFLPNSTEITFKEKILKSEKNTLVNKLVKESTLLSVEPSTVSDYFLSRNFEDGPKSYRSFYVGKKYSTVCFYKANARSEGSWSWSGLGTPGSLEMGITGTNSFFAYYETYGGSYTFIDEGERFSGFDLILKDGTVVEDFYVYKSASSSTYDRFQYTSPQGPLFNYTETGKYVQSINAFVDDSKFYFYYLNSEGTTEHVDVVGMVQPTTLDAQPTSNLIKTINLGAVVSGGKLAGGVTAKGFIWAKKFVLNTDTGTLLPVPNTRTTNLSPSYIRISKDGKTATYYWNWYSEQSALTNRSVTVDTGVLPDGEISRYVYSIVNGVESVTESVFDPATDSKITNTKWRFNDEFDGSTILFDKTK